MALKAVRKLAERNFSIGWRRQGQQKKAA
jgi:hypothetical protein